MLVQLSGGSSSTIANVILWATIIAIAYLVYSRSQKEKASREEAARLRQETDAKLESDYNYDEQALTNDLSTMKSY